MAIIDADGRYIYANEAHADVYGYDDPEAFVGEHWQMCYADEEVESFEEAVMPTLEAEGQWRGEATGKRRDGTEFPQKLTLTALPDGGLVCVVRDITERKAREREIEAQNATMAALHAVMTDLVSCRSIDEVCELTIDAAEEILDFDLCYVGIVEGESIVPRARPIPSRAQSSSGPNETTSRRSPRFRASRSPTDWTPDEVSTSRPRTTARDASPTSILIVPHNRWKTAISAVSTAAS
jgi:PAS domain S-box-containing protein